MCYDHLLSPRKMYKLSINSKKISKLIEKRLNQTIVFIGIALVGSFFLLSTDIPSPRAFSPSLPLSSLMISDAKDKATPSLEDHLEDLPIGQITIHNAQGEWGTAVLIPQYHRYPGTESKDPVNNSAQKTQEEIYEILPHINEYYNTNLVMVEGELYGQVSSEKLKTVNEKVTERNVLSGQLQRLTPLLKKDGLDSQEEKFIKDCKDAVAEMDRDIILTGAPFKLNAEGKDIVLFGSENQFTREESKKLVKNYIYLQDREKQLHGQSKRLSSRNNQSNKLFSNDLQSLLSKLLKSKSPQDSLAVDLKKFKNIAKSNGNDELLEIIKNIEATLRASKDTIFAKNKGLSIQSTQNRKENPYAYINNPKKIENMLQETEQKINEVVIDKRNQETAENFTQMLREKKHQNGIIQFGAGHEQGLIQELNKQGISVVVITPSEVLKRNLQQNQKGD